MPEEGSTHEAHLESQVNSALQKIELAVVFCIELARSVPIGG